MIEIHDSKDPRISVFLNQKDAWLQAAHNPDSQSTGAHSAEGFFMAEGVLVVEQLLQSKFETLSVLVTKNRAKNVSSVLDRVPANVPIYCVSQELMDEIVGFPMHRGLLACGVRRPDADALSLAKECRSLVILEDLSNHDNVGSVFRSVAAMGGQGVGIILTRRCCDPLYRKSLRVSMGHVLRVPYAIVGCLDHFLSQIHPIGYHSVAFALGDSSVSLDDVQIADNSRLALLFGAEGPGLQLKTLQIANQLVRIEMTKDVDSLNIAVAAAVGIHRLMKPM